MTMRQAGAEKVPPATDKTQIPPIKLVIVRDPLLSYRGLNGSAPDQWEMARELQQQQ